MEYKHSNPAKYQQWDARLMGISLEAFRRRRSGLCRVSSGHGFISPRLGICFDLSGPICFGAIGAIILFSAIIPRRPLGFQWEAPKGFAHRLRPAAGRDV